MFGFNENTLIQTLILQAYQEFRGDFWLRYDRTLKHTTLIEILKQCNYL